MSVSLSELTTGERAGIQAAVAAVAAGGSALVFFGATLTVAVLVALAVAVGVVAATLVGARLWGE